jgi:hypothetical protein
MDQIAKTYRHNDDAQVKLNVKATAAVNPKVIISPGKIGVWPNSHNKAD